MATGSQPTKTPGCQLRTRTTAAPARLVSCCTVVAIAGRLTTTRCWIWPLRGLAWRGRSPQHTYTFAASAHVILPCCIISSLAVKLWSESYCGQLSVLASRRPLGKSLAHANIATLQTDMSATTAALLNMLHVQQYRGISRDLECSHMAVGWLGLLQAWGLTTCMRRHSRSGTHLTYPVLRRDGTCRACVGMQPRSAGLDPRGVEP